MGRASTGVGALPSVERLLSSPEFTAMLAGFGRTQVLEQVRETLERWRGVLTTDATADAPDAASLAIECEGRLRDRAKPALRPVFNLTGTVLHTNLGRALLPEEAVEAAVTAMRTAVNLEFDLDSGGRGERDRHVEDLLMKLTGAEAAVVVNNNAAAVYLALNSLAARKEVIVSRGELVEIGGSFRVSDIMRCAGCRLREVGTTNRTHLSDFADAIDLRRTGMLLKVHTSNYRIVGFTSEVPLCELGALARAHGIALVNDLGAGSLVDLEAYGLPHETTPREALADGADLVTFSGDKLLGGPQCGLIVGRADLVAAIRRNPMKRALRVDKVRLAALEAVLQLYRRPEQLAQRLPTLWQLTRAQSAIRDLALRMQGPLSAAVGHLAQVSVVDCLSQIGSGALPVDSLASVALALRPIATSKAAADRLARLFRALPVPVLGRLQAGQLLFDLRCLEDEAGFLRQLDGLDWRRGVGVEPTKDVVDPSRS